MALLSIGSSYKINKSDAFSDEYVTAIMYMIPARDLCPMSETAGCAGPCLVSAGRGVMSNVMAGRQRKSDLFRADPVLFIDMLAAEIRIMIKRVAKQGKKLAVRLNGTSDIPYENYCGSNGLTLMEMFPEVQYYDYTKLIKRKVPANYHLTASYSGVNPKYAASVLKSPLTLSVVFSGALPSEFQGRQVVNGDLHDLTFIHPQGVVLGLSAKGKAKKDTSGFVVNSNIIGIGA